MVEIGMTLLRRIMSYVLLGVSGCLLHPSSALAQIASGPAAQHDRQHDFDFEDGTWKIHLKRLQHPLTGSHTWVEFDGTTVTRGFPFQTLPGERVDHPHHAGLWFNYATPTTLTS